MTIINLVTSINAPSERVFDLARSIDAHMASTEATSERAVDGVTSGLIGLGQQVTWEATHFGVKQRLTVRMTRFDRPREFADEMVAGAFRSMKHTHEFIDHQGVTEMRDRFEFEAPLGFLGRIAERLFLAGYMRRFLVIRNAALKQLAESDAWQRFLQKA
jgi:ligand-binding SRPBCC domain-containing protein